MTPTPEMVERAARALHDGTCSGHWLGTCRQAAAYRRHATDALTAALVALAPHVTPVESGGTDGD